MLKMASSVRENKGLKRMFKHNLYVTNVVETRLCRDKYAKNRRF